MKKLEAFIWLILGGAFGFILPLGIEQLIQLFSPISKDPSRAFVFYFLIAMISGILSGRTIVWLKADKNDNRISAVIAFTVFFIAWCAIGTAMTGNPTYIVGLVFTVVVSMASVTVNAVSTLRLNATEKPRN